MRRNVRLLLVAAMLLLAAIVLLSILIRPRTGGRPAVDQAESEAPRDSQASAPTPRPVVPQSPGSAPAAAHEPSAPVPMPEGLAEDLAMFNSAQLQAELESIALSYPAVVVVSVACDGQPCTAEVQVQREEGDEQDELEELDTFLDMVSKRFQGYLGATFRDLTTASGEPAVRAVLMVGGAAPRPAPRYRAFELDGP